MTCADFRFCPACGKPLTHDVRAVAAVSGLAEEVGPGALVILKALHQFGPAGAVEIRARLEMRTARYQLGRLERRKLVERFRSEPNANRVYRITEHGRLLLA